MTSVESSSIDDIEHDPISSVLKVRFKSGGRTYHYHGVTADQHAQLMSASSVGAHFSEHIRDNFRGVRI